MKADGDRADATWLFGLFSLAFAVSLILHVLWWEGFEVASVDFLVVLAALWTVLRPTSVARFLTMLAAEVLSVALDMPEVGSHTLLVGLSGACVLAYVAWTSPPIRRLPHAGALFERIAPFLRVQLLVVYAAAAVAKMNTDFFDAGISCAISLSARVAWFDPSLLAGSWRVAPAMWGTVLTELALVALLSIPRTRVAGLAVGGAFHAVLALAGNVPFSALALALYVVFLPVDTAGRMRAVAAERPALGRWADRARSAAGSRAAFPVAVGCWLAAAVVFSFEPAAGRTLIANGTRVGLVALMLGGGWLLALGLARGRPWIQPSASLRLGHAVFAVGIGLLVANSLSPYLGLKTESSFTMFSNLHTEAGRWNHAFIPEAVRVFDPQDSLVRVTDSNDPTLERRTRDGARMVRFELERYVRLRPGTRATYVLVGAPGAPIRTTGSDVAAPWGAPILDRVAKFRDVRPSQRGGC
ncbi:MAG TPA: HTTM domain-containing protein [Solirubrobacteraceae bacterium]|nr:HTTM domain-containing protein [Solirubrobacteraceae bacterium]